MIEKLTNEERAEITRLTEALAAAERGNTAGATLLTAAEARIRELEAEVARLRSEPSKFEQHARVYMSEQESRVRELEAENVRVREAMTARVSALEVVEAVTVPHWKGRAEAAEARVRELALSTETDSRLATAVGLLREARDACHCRFEGGRAFLSRDIREFVASAQPAAPIPHTDSPCAACEDNLKRYSNFHGGHDDQPAAPTRTEGEFAQGYAAGWLQGQRDAPGYLENKAPTRTEAEQNGPLRVEAQRDALFDMLREFIPDFEIESRLARRGLK